MRLVEGVDGVEVVGLGPDGMHARPLELLDNERRRRACEGRAGGLVHALQHRAGEGQATIQGEVGAVHVGPLLPGVVEGLGIHQDHLLEAVGTPVGDHALVVPGGDHGVVLLAVAVPDQHREEVGRVRKGRQEVHHGREGVGLPHAAVAHGHRKELVRVKQGTGHGEVLPLAQGAGGGEDAGNGPGQVAEQPLALAEALAHLGYRVDAHGLQGRIQEHGAVEAGGVVAHLGDDVGVAEHDQGRMGLGAGGEPARVAGPLGPAHLQGQVTQGVGTEQGLVDGGRVRAVGDGLGTLRDRGLSAQGLEVGPGGSKVVDTGTEVRGGGLVLGRGAHGAVSGGCWIAGRPCAAWVCTLGALLIFRNTVHVAHSEILAALWPDADAVPDGSPRRRVCRGGWAAPAGYCNHSATLT